MILLANIYEGGAYFAAGAVLCFIAVRWMDRNTKQAAAFEAGALREKALNEAEKTTRDARLAASEEALKLREQMDQSFAARRAERTEQERRLSEREALINSQLERMVQAEKSVKVQEESLR